MRRWISFLMIASLIILSSFVVYKEAFALPPFCDDIAEDCSGCVGIYFVDSCWWYNGLQYCWVRCECPAGVPPGCDDICGLLALCVY